MAACLPREHRQKYKVECTNVQIMYISCKKSLKFRCLFFTLKKNLPLYFKGREEGGEAIEILPSLYVTVLGAVPGGSQKPGAQSGPPKGNDPST